jgi:hypothetical protein
MAGKYISNEDGLPDAKNKLIRREGYVEMVLNGKGGSIKLDEGSLSKVVDSSWSIATGKSNNYVSATIEGERVAMHRLLLDVLASDIKLEFINEDRFDLRLRNIRPKSIGNIQRAAERERAEISTELQKAAGVLKSTTDRAELRQMALSMCADALAFLGQTMHDPNARGSDRVAASKEILNRGLGPIGEEDPITGAAVPRIEISFVKPATSLKDISPENPAEEPSINITSAPKLIPVFGNN